MHPPAQFTISERPENEMEAVRHQTPSRNPHGYACAGPFQQICERLIVFGMVKDLSLRIAPVQHTVVDLSDRSSCRSRHELIVLQERVGTTRKRNVPFSQPSKEQALQVATADRGLAQIEEPSVIRKRSITYQNDPFFI
jgi:diaminopimelate epimerase